jgi:glycosyltransferase involved in cell wall biosynthesis
MPMMVGLMDALAGSGADVLHAHSHRYGHVLETAAVAERRNIPLVVSTHYHPADHREPAWKRGMLRLQDVGFGATAYRVARALVVETEREAAMVREFAPADRIRVIPPGIDLAEWSAPGPEVAPAGLPEEYFLFFGRIAANKGVPSLVEAIARLPPESRRPLVLMGPDWGDRAAIEERARTLGLERWVVFLGHVERTDQARAVVRRARALVLPSEWEAFGLVLLIAMAVGTPIVATAVGGVPEVLDHGRTGLLVPYGNGGALTEALGQILDDPVGAQGRVQAGRDRVRQFDWSVAAGRHRALYQEVVAAG